MDKFPVAEETPEKLLPPIHQAVRKSPATRYTTIHLGHTLMITGLRLVGPAATRSWRSTIVGYLMFGDHVDVWGSHDKAQIRTLESRGAMGQLLDIYLWRSGTTRVLMHGVVIRCLNPRKLETVRSSALQTLPRSVQSTTAGVAMETDWKEWTYKWLHSDGRAQWGQP